MKKFPFIILLVISLCNPNSLFCQENFKSGLIVDKNLDTIRGFIDYKNWDKNPDEIIFKKSISANSENFSPTDIIEFRVQDEIYVSGVVDYEASSLSIKKLTYNSELDIQKATIFLQTLFKGNKDLYYFKNDDARENFYIRHDKKFQLLVHKMSFDKKKGKKIIVYNNNYLNQLVDYLKDCPHLAESLTKAKYNRSTLTKFFDAYYKCHPNLEVFRKEVEKISTEYGVLAGGSLTRINFTGDNIFRSLTKVDFENSLAVSFGLFINLVLPRNQRKWVLNNEILLTTYNFQGIYEEIISTEYYSKYTTELGYTQLKINNLLRYRRPIGSSWIFVSGGVVNSFAIKQTNTQLVESKFYVEERIEEREAVSEIRIYELGLLLGGGIQRDKFSIELRFERGNGMSNFTQLESIVKRYYLLMGYKF